MTRRRLAACGGQQVGCVNQSISDSFFSQVHLRGHRRVDKSLVMTSSADDDQCILFLVNILGACTHILLLEALLVALSDDAGRALLNLRARRGCCRRWSLSVERAPSRASSDSTLARSAAAASVSPRGHGPNRRALAHCRPQENYPSD